MARALHLAGQRVEARRVRADIRPRPPLPPGGRRAPSMPGREQFASARLFFRDKKGRTGQLAAMIRLGCEGKVVRLVLDRPEARNAIPGQGWDLIADRLTEVARTDARLLVVSGAGGAFCSGVDLSDFGSFQGDQQASARLRQRIRAALDRLRGLEIPTIAMIEGPCYGAGVALAIACDLRIAAPEAKFAITPAKLGLAYPQEDVHRLVRLVGAGQAARLLFTAGMIDAMEARRIGLVEIVEPAAAAKPILQSMLDNSPDSLAVLKRSIRLTAEGVRSDPEQDRCFDALLSSEDVARRLDALRRQ